MLVPNLPANLQLVRSMLQEYYGKYLKSASDLSQKACCTGETQRRYSEILELIPAEVKEKHYGCGCPIPDDDLTGLLVLDLGSGAGVDSFILSFLTGPEGKVHGIDMTEEQLAIASSNVSHVSKRFGYTKPNVFFYKDFIETASEISDGSIDLVVSDCVVNLSPRKDLVFKTIYRVLKEGGEFYISDIVADRRVPKIIQNDPELIAECLGGAEYEHDYLDFIKDAGFLDPRIVKKQEVQRDVANEPIVFYSITVRGFKFSEALDRRCEDYGQIAIYNRQPCKGMSRFYFDDHHIFEANKPTPVCRNTARMLQETRLSKY
ncbi:MAG TPA: methyltransferase domain-containing protein, partial [Acidobacteriota bacterium]|nr:methyltransferase domain-containing protein [Acidobacteriota bacterium]